MLLVLPILLVGCNEEEVNALKEQNADLNATLTEATEKGSELETLLAEKSAEAKDLAANLNTAKTNLAVAQKEIETIKKLQEDLIARQKANKQDQDIIQWNSTIDQIDGIAELMQNYKGKSLLTLSRTRGWEAIKEEVDNTELYLNERKAEADALAFKLPPCNDRSLLIENMKTLKDALAYKHFYEGLMWSAGGVASPKFKKAEEEYDKFRTEAGDAKGKFSSMKRKENRKTE